MEADSPAGPGAGAPVGLMSWAQLRTPFNPDHVPAGGAAGETPLEQNLEAKEQAVFLKLLDDF